MEKKFNGKSGITIKMLMQKLKREMSLGFDFPSQKRNARGNISNSFKKGKLTTNDWKNISIGLQIIEKILNDGFDKIERELLSGQDDVSKVKKSVNGFQKVILESLERLEREAFDELDFQERIDSLYDYSEISQAARDGIIIKQGKRKEIMNGEEKEVMYDTSMSPSEVVSILQDYEKYREKLSFKRFDNYLGIGFGVAGIVGSILKNKRSKDNSIALSLSTMVIEVLEILKYFVINKNNKNGKQEYNDLIDEEDRLTRDLFSNEQVSHKAEESSIEGIVEVANQSKKLTNNMNNTEFACNAVVDIISAIIYGAYMSKRIKIKENGKIDGKSLASAIISLRTTQYNIGHLLVLIRDIGKSRKDEEKLKEIYKKVQNILEQMDEKVYPLEGAKRPFDSISISNFTGHFYPKKNYETGEINYGVTITVPEFSMKRGDVVLLSGDSGSGKSTFLRFLKRGDINNRKGIQIDDDEMVDNLGNEYISFRPSINLGNETNVLYQITGKKNISDLSDDMKARLESILRELKFDNSDLLEQLASKNFEEFSTGQQRRLALSKMFYRIDDGASVIIVDEPVGNVEDKLIRNQLEMIKKYAEAKNLMLILTTHRLDLAEDLATKRYNINKNGKLEQIPIKEKEQEL